MAVYFWTIAFVLILASLAENSSLRGQNIKLKLRDESTVTRIMLFLTAALLIFVAGCRYKVGTDFGAYYKGFRIYGNRLSEAIQNFDEPGLPLIVEILALFTKDGAYIIFTCSLFTIGLFLLTAYRNENHYLLVSLLFVLTGIWDGTFNGVRQCFASAILFFGHRYIYDKKFWKYALTVFFAACFHKTAVVMLVLYFLLRNRVSFRNLLLLAIGTALVSANYDTIFSFAGLLKDKDFSSLDTYATTTVNLFRILVAGAPAVACIIIHRGKELSSEQTFYMNAMIMHASAMVAASNSAYLARIGIYTGPFIMIALPRLFKLENERIESVVKIWIVFLYAAYWYIGISGSADLNNFQWIWNK